jgi:class 3 adenylate cyclase
LAKKQRATKWKATGTEFVPVKLFVTRVDTCVKENHEEVEKLVVFFDICSSSKIVEGLKKRDKVAEYANLLIRVKDFLQGKERANICEMYKFIGDGWVLLFSPDIPGSKLASFLAELSDFYDQRLSELLHALENRPVVLGLTFGVDSGKLTKIVMSEQDEYIGRPLNIAARLQSKVKDIDDKPAYKALISSPTAQILQIPRNYVQEENLPVGKLRNIEADDFYCTKVTLLNVRN